MTICQKYKNVIIKNFNVLYNIILPVILYFKSFSLNTCLGVVLIFLIELTFILNV